MVKHLQIRMEEADYTQLRILCAMRGCSQQALLQDLIRSCIRSAPEFKAGETSGKET